MCWHTPGIPARGDSGIKIEVSLKWTCVTWNFRPARLHSKTLTQKTKPSNSNKKNDPIKPHCTFTYLEIFQAPCILRAIRTPLKEHNDIMRVAWLLGMALTSFYIMCLYLCTILRATCIKISKRWDLNHSSPEQHQAERGVGSVSQLHLCWLNAPSKITAMALIEPIIDGSSQVAKSYGFFFCIFLCWNTFCAKNFTCIVKRLR